MFPNRYIKITFLFFPHILKHKLIILPKYLLLTYFIKFNTLNYFNEKSKTSIFQINKKKQVLFISTFFWNTNYISFKRKFVSYKYKRELSILFPNNQKLQETILSMIGLHMIGLQRIRSGAFTINSNS